MWPWLHLKNIAFIAINIPWKHPYSGSAPQYCGKVHNVRFRTEAGRKASQGAVAMPLRSASTYEQLSVVLVLLLILFNAAHAMIACGLCLRRICDSGSRTINLVSGTITKAQNPYASQA
jgi:hypothetical protein